MAICLHNSNFSSMQTWRRPESVALENVSAWGDVKKDDFFLSSKWIGSNGSKNASWKRENFLLLGVREWLNRKSYVWLVCQLSSVQSSPPLTQSTTTHTSTDTRVYKKHFALSAAAVPWENSKKFGEVVGFREDRIVIPIISLKKRKNKFLNVIWLSNWRQIELKKQFTYQ